MIDRKAKRLLLVGDSLSGPLGTGGDQGDGGWEISRAVDGFAALDAAVQDHRLEAALVDVEAAWPRPAALAGALHAARPALPIYLVCPPWLEPDTRRIAAGCPTVDYLVSPLGPADWQALGRRLDPAKPPSPAEADDVALPGLTALDRLMDKLGRGVDDFLPAAAEWASAALEGRRVRLTVAGRFAFHPPGQEFIPAETLPLTAADGAAAELAIETLSAESPERVSRVIAVLRQVLSQRQKVASLRQMAYTDSLSGVYNRRYLMQFLGQMLVRAERQRFHVTLLVFDIDEFKRYNDRFSHAAGDEIIRNVARLMRQCTRPQDVVARIGGDEFAVLFWDSGPPRQPGSQHPRQVQAVVERFRRVLGNHRFALLGPDAQGTLTVSGGLAGFPADARDAESLLGRALEALKAAKLSGKDRLHIVGRPPPAPTLP